MLTAQDGHEFSVYSAEPSTDISASPGPFANLAEPRTENTRLGAIPAGIASGLVVIQEIFGVNPHIRAVCDGFAAQGYRVVAPALFDRVQRGMELEYGAKGFEVGAGLRKLIPIEYSMMDINACIDHLRGAPGEDLAPAKRKFGGAENEQKFGGAENENSAPAKVGCVGYCWGGTLAWVAAQRFDLDAAVGYYGGSIAGHLLGDLYCPVLLHFGEDDKSISAEDVGNIRTAYPGAEIHTYAGAGHGYNRDPDAAHTKLALERTLIFLGNTLGD